LWSISIGIDIDFSKEFKWFTRLYPRSQVGGDTVMAWTSAWGFFAEEQMIWNRWRCCDWLAFIGVYNLMLSWII
jgi:hypothetical protein